MDIKPLLTSTTGVSLHERFSEVLVPQTRAVDFDPVLLLETSMSSSSSVVPQLKVELSSPMLHPQAPPLCMRRRRKRGLWKCPGWRSGFCRSAAPRPWVYWGFMKKYRRFPSVGRRPRDLWHRRPLMRSSKWSAGINQNLRPGAVVSTRRCGYSRESIPTKRQLDSELEDYMSLSRRRLDAELDDYMSLSRRRLDAELDLYMAMVGDVDVAPQEA